MSQRQAAYLPTLEPRAIVSQFIEEKRYALSAKSTAFYEDMVGRAFLAFLEAEPVGDLADVTTPVVVAYLNHERPHLAASTFAGRFSAAKHFFAWCVEQGFLTSSPMEKMRRPKVPKEGRVAFTREEVLRLKKVCDAKPGVAGIRDRALLQLFVGAGARAEEVENLNWESVDWPHRTLWLSGKGDKTRPVNMSSHLSAALREWRRAARKWGIDSASGPVFWTQRRRPIGYSAIESFVRLLGVYAGVENCHPHRFRHTFATEMFRQHRNLIAVQEALGHEKIETTMTYLRQLKVDYRDNIRLASPDEWLLS